MTQRVEVVKKYSPDVLTDVLSIIEQSFPEYWEESGEISYYRGLLEHDDSIVILLREREKTVGCLIAAPQDFALREIKKYDPLMKKDNDRLYIDTLAIVPNYRKKFGYFMLIIALLTEVRRRGICRFSMHLRVETGFNKRIQALFGKHITLSREVCWKWNHGEEKMEYVEAMFASSLLWRIRIILFIHRMLSISKRLWYTGKR